MFKKLCDFCLRWTAFKKNDYFYHFHSCELYSRPSGTEIFLHFLHFNYLYVKKNPTKPFHAFNLHVGVANYKECLHICRYNYIAYDWLHLNIWNTGSKSSYSPFFSSFLSLHTLHIYFLLNAKCSSQLNISWNSLCFESFRFRITKNSEKSDAHRPTTDEFFRMNSSFSQHSRLPQGMSLRTEQCPQAASVNDDNSKSILMSLPTTFSQDYYSESERIFFFPDQKKAASW